MFNFLILLQLWTYSIPFLTQATKITRSSSAAESAEAFAHRITIRAFLYATSINMLLGVAITASVAYYCQIDSVWYFEEGCVVL